MKVVPGVSVIIATHNRAQVLEAALRSVFAQTYANYETIVVDDGSTDDTQAIIDAKYSERVQYISQANHGPAKARNRAIGVAKGRYIAFLDDDDVWAPEKLQWQVDVLDRDSKVGLVYGAGYVVRQGVRMFEPSQSPAPTQLGVIGQLLRGNFFGICSVMVRSAALQDSGLFDGAVVPCEDWDLWLRLAARGCRFAYIKHPIWEYRFHDGNAGLDTARLLRGRIAVVDKFFDSEAAHSARGVGLTRNHCLARQYVRAGMDYYIKLELDKARAAWWHALKLDSRFLSPALASLIAKSYLGSCLLRRAREAKRTLFYARP